MAHVDSLPHDHAPGDAADRESRLARFRRRAFNVERRGVKVLLVVALLLVAARIALPFVVEHYLNQKLAEMEGYRGHVEDVDIALIRGAYRIEGLQIVKTGGEAPVPFFSAPSTDISIEWKALLDGKIVAEVVLTRPELNFIVAGGGVEAQTGEENDWRATVDEMVPITINRFEIRDGEVHYHDYGNDPHVDFRADRMDVVAQGLSTVRREGEELPAVIHADARVQRSGSLVMDARLDPWAEQPTFNLALRLRDLPARELNQVLRAYAGVDAEGGMTFLYTEVRAREGRFEGYVKPMAEGLSIFRLGEDGDFFDVLGDAIVGLVAEIFENQGTDRLAVQVPVSGRFESPEVDAWGVVGSVLYNAFVQAIQHGLDNPGDWGPENEAADRAREEREERQERAREQREQRQEERREQAEQAREQREERQEEREEQAREAREEREEQAREARERREERAEEARERREERAREASSE